MDTGLGRHFIATFTAAACVPTHISYLITMINDWNIIMNNNVKYIPPHYGSMMC